MPESCEHTGQAHSHTAVPTKPGAGGSGSGIYWSLPRKALSKAASCQELRGRCWSPVLPTLPVFLLIHAFLYPRTAPLPPNCSPLPQPPFPENRWFQGSCYVPCPSPAPSSTPPAPECYILEFQYTALHTLSPQRPGPRLRLASSPYQFEPWPILGCWPDSESRFPPPLHSPMAPARDWAKGEAVSCSCALVQAHWPGWDPLSYLAFLLSDRVVSGSSTVPDTK